MLNKKEIGITCGKRYRGRTMKNLTLLITMALLGLVASGAIAQYQINWYSINSGGGLVTGGGYKLNSTIGQPAAGFVQNASFLHWIGFWAGEVPNPTIVGAVSAAKLLQDGTFASISGKIATTSETDFSGFFYIEEADRSSGIRVAVPAGPIAGLARGSTVNVIGTMGTTSAGERQLTGPIVIIVGSATPLLPLGMNNVTLGGGKLGVPPLGQYGVTGGFGVNNVGLLVQTWGRVVETGVGYVVIYDGSVDGSGTAIPVRVSTTGLAVPPGMDEYVTVIGISSLYMPGAERLRLVLPRGDLDIGRP